MNNLSQKLTEDMKAAMKSGDSLTLSTVKLLISAIHNKEIEKRTKLSKSFDKLRPSALRRSSRGLSPEGLRLEEIPSGGEGQISDAKELEEKSRLTDEEIIEVVSSEVKKHKDSIVAYESARPDLAEKEKQELEILKKYAPKELSEAEIKTIVKAKIAETGASSVKDLGKVMGRVTQETKGRADGALVKKIVEEELGSK